MNGNPGADDLLPTLELAMSNHPVLGSSNYIRDRMIHSFERRLSAIGNDVPSARTLLGALGQAQPDVRRRTIGDTVLRSAIKCAHATLATQATQGIPLAICSRLFDIAAHHISKGDSGFLIEAGENPCPKTGNSDWHSAIWNARTWEGSPLAEACDANVYRSTLRYIVDSHQLGPIAGADAMDVANARRGQQLLEALLPTLAQSASSHNQLVACFDPAGNRRTTSSSSQYRLAGMIFINKTTLADPWCAAEHLFHEFLHQKLYDFRLGHTLLAENFDESGERTVCSLWNAPGLSRDNMWNAHRAIAAFHVYVHLALLATAAERHGDALVSAFGARTAMTTSRQALDRAQHLSRELKSSCPQSDLGTAGIYMIDWLTSIMALIDGAGSRKPGRAHLLLQRYVKEHARVDAEMDQIRLRPQAVSALDAIADDELNMASEILKSIDAEDPQPAAILIDSHRMEKAPCRFSYVRSLVANRIAEKCDADGGEGLLRLDRDGRFEGMVERGSEKLLAIVNDYSPLLVQAKRTADEIRFGKSCLDDVGRLLARLAAAVPHNGRVLEIGTGTGVGLAWLIKGLASRTDVTVVTIEADDAIFNAAKDRHWPSYVQLVHGDAASLFCAGNKYDLIFADAYPVKFEHILPIIELLEPGGQLVIDDLQPRSHASSAADLPDRLWNIVRRHGQLQDVALDKGSGILLATKTQTTSAANEGERAGITPRSLPSQITQQFLRA